MTLTDAPAGKRLEAPRRTVRTLKGAMEEIYTEDELAINIGPTGTDT